MPSFPQLASVLCLFAFNLRFAALGKRILDPDHLFGAAFAYFWLPRGSVVVIVDVVITVVWQGCTGKLLAFFGLAVSLMMLLLLLLRCLAISIETAVVVNFLQREA